MKPFETHDSAYITKAIGIVARAKGMTAVSKEAKLLRESLISLLERGYQT